MLAENKANADPITQDELYELLSTSKCSNNKNTRPTFYEYRIMKKITNFL